MGKYQEVKFLNGISQEVRSNFNRFLIEEEETDELHSVYVAYIHGIQHKLTYFMRTLPNF